MEARSNLDPERPDFLHDRLSASDRARRPVEGGEEPVPGRVDLGPSKALEEGTHAQVVSLDEITPTRVAELRKLLRRTERYP